MRTFASLWTSPSQLPFFNFVTANPRGIIIIIRRRAVIGWCQFMDVQTFPS
jgi:hypothetical protein